MPVPRRKSIRLPGYDYSAEGGYFITIVTKDREALFGEVVDGEMVLNELGEIVQFTWNDLINHNPDIGLGEFTIMPNHVHGIIMIFEPIVGAGSKPAQIDDAQPGAGAKNAEPGAGFPMTQRTRQGAKNAEPAPTRATPLSEIVRQFKTFSAKRINQIRHTPGQPVWQRNYYDHIIGTDREYERIAEYIANNPLYWQSDHENSPASA